RVPPGGLPSHSAHSYVMNPDGTNQQLLITKPPLSTMQCSVPRLSWDGQMMALSVWTQDPSGQTWAMWTANADGSNAAHHTNGERSLDVVWAGPRRVAGIFGHHGIVIMNTDETDAVQFDLGPDWTRSDLAANPNHSILAFTARRVGNSADEEIH